MTSVARKIHMPRLAESRCCSSVAKWCRSAGLSAPWESVGAALGIAVVELSLNGHLRVRRVQLLVVVGFPGHDRLLLKIVSGGRRRRFPFEAGGVPRIVGRGLAVAHRP